VSLPIASAHSGILMYAIAITADIYKALTVRKVHMRDSYLSEIQSHPAR